MTRRLTISILPGGTITAEVSGTPGPDCLSAIDQLRYMLNADVSDSKPTPEFSGSTTSTKLTDNTEIRLGDWA